MSSLPIAEYALISDCHSAALVSRDGSIDWLCLPRFDSPAVFARLLDEDAGHWTIRVRDARVTRRYLPETLVLETSFEAPGGTALLTDAMIIGANERGHELGCNSPIVLVRSIVCTKGSIQVEFEFAPRPEFGLVNPLMTRIENGLTARGGACRAVLGAPFELGVEESTGRAAFTLREGEVAGFALQHGQSWDTPTQPWTQDEIAHRLADTIEAWRSWSALHQRYEGPWRDMVHHSGRVLQALTFAPTGAMVAAPTTSLAESVGGARNWDYRYTWVRDASWTLNALWVAACPDEANRFFEWMAYAVAVRARDSHLQIVFGLGGERDLSERELPHLRGWRDSSPVRVGNAAWTQEQLDVYGELLGAARQLRGLLAEIDPTTRRFFVEAADTAAARWTETDRGIWEVRGEPQHFLHSKLMCWAALDAAIDLVPEIGGEDRVPDWTQARAAIADAIHEKGWSEEAQAFTQSFGSTNLDASVLMMPQVGFISPRDPKMLKTIDAIEQRLTDKRGLVYRYRSHDGLEGEEGSFLFCTFWLAKALALAGEVERAKAAFERAVSHANDVGLLSEEIDSESGEMLGNFPQAFSHIGLVNAAWAISQAQNAVVSPSTSLGVNSGAKPLSP